MSALHPKPNFFSVLAGYRYVGTFIEKDVYIGTYTSRQEDRVITVSKNDHTMRTLQQVFGYVDSDRFISGNCHGTFWDCVRAALALMGFKP